MGIGPATTVLGLALLPAATARARGFEDDVAFLRKHVEVVVLEDARTGARVAIVPAWQGRVMTSAGGEKNAPGYGWINEELVASGKLGPHINAFGGEDRLWLGPEGGQFSIFFRKGDPFDLAHWQTPPLIDTEPWLVSSRDAGRVSFLRGTSATCPSSSVPWGYPAVLLMMLAVGLSMVPYFKKKKWW